MLNWWFSALSGQNNATVDSDTFDG